MSSKNSNKKENSRLPLFRSEALEAQGQRLFGDVIIVQPLAFKVLTLFLFSILGVTLLFLVFGNYSNKETVQGFLMPDQGISKVLVPGGGVISNVFIKEGENIEAGDPLVSVNFERALPTGVGVETRLINYLNEQIEFTETQILEEQNHSAISKEQLIRDIASLEQEMIQLKARMELQKQITVDAKQGMEVAKDLAEQGYVSQIELTQRRNNFLNSQASEASLKQQIEKTENEINSKNADLEAHPGHVETTINQLKAQASELRQRLAETEGQRGYTVTSPISGKVSGVQAYSGGTTNSAIPLMTILPENSKFLAELYVPTRAIGLIKPGQKVRIFYDAFRYQSFGTYPGTIIEISKTILSPDEVSGPITPSEPVYRVVASLDLQEVEGFGETFPLQAGMTLEAVIVLEEQTFFEMLLEPLKALKGRT